MKEITINLFEMNDEKDEENLAIFFKMWPISLPNGRDLISFNCFIILTQISYQQGTL